MGKKNKQKNIETIEKKRKNIFDDAYKEYDTKSIQQEWGDERINESNKNWNNMTKEEQHAVLEECSDIFEGLAEYIGTDPSRFEVTELMVRWHKFIQNFYEPSLEVLRCLGLMYVYDPDFSGKFQQIDPNLPDFLGKAVNKYVDVLEEKWIESQCNILEQ